MPNPTPNRPLWQVMHDAAIEISQTSGPIASRRFYAAALRAIAEEVWSRGQSGEAVDYGDIFNWLHKEADRAEMGK